MLPINIGVCWFLLDFKTNRVIYTGMDYITNGWNSLPILRQAELATSVHKTKG
jgi:hypothetical protein